MQIPLLHSAPLTIVHPTSKAQELFEVLCMPVPYNAPSQHNNAVLNSQDAWSTLGAPSAIFSRQTPGLPQGGSANPRAAQQQVSASPADYFYNYFDR